MAANSSLSQRHPLIHVTNMHARTGLSAVGDVLTSGTRTFGFVRASSQMKARGIPIPESMRCRGCSVEMTA